MSKRLDAYEDSILSKVFPHYYETKLKLEELKQKGLFPNTKEELLNFDFSLLKAEDVKEIPQHP